MQQGRAAWCPTRAALAQLCQESYYENVDEAYNSNAFELLITHNDIKFVQISRPGLRGLYPLNVPGAQHFFSERSMRRVRYLVLHMDYGQPDG
jgi:hypothetical protein